MTNKADSGDFQPLPPGTRLATEWNTFCREYPRLIAEGHRDRMALIKGDELAGIYDSEREALVSGYQKFGVTTFLVQPIRPLGRPLRSGNSWRCPT